MGIQFGGLASGLDTNAIIAALVSVRSRPIQLLEAQRAQEQNKLSEVGVLEGLVKSLEDETQRLLSLGGFFSHSVTSADESIASFSVTGDVTPGAHTILVNRLASAARYNFSPATTVTDPDAGDFGAGDITFTYDGADYTVAIAAGSSLNDIAAAITSEAGTDVSAAVVNVGASSSPDYQLVLTGNDTGADFDLVNLAADASIGLGASATSLTTAQNAEVEVDNLVVERSTNVFSDVLQGISFTVLSESDPGVSTTFTADLDVEATQANLQTFVDAYNAVVNFIGGQSTFSEDSGPGGVLFGDRLLRSVSSTLNRALFDPDLATVQNDTTGFSTLGLVGFDLQDDGTITIDAEDFAAKLTEDPEAFEALFTDPTAGVLAKLDSGLDGLLDGFDVGSGAALMTFDSAFTARRNALDSIIDSIDTQVERLEFSLEKYEEGLVRRFANLESIVGGLNAQSAFLTSNQSFSSRN